MHITYALACPSTTGANNARQVLSQGACMDKDWTYFKPQLLAGDEEAQARHELATGVYCSQDGKRKMIVIGTEVKEKVFEIVVDINVLSAITLITDSVEVLRWLMSRGFPLTGLCWVLFGKEDDGSGSLKTETSFSLFTLFDRSANPPVEDMGVRLRVIPRREKNAFELRLIKQ